MGKVHSSCFGYILILFILDFSKNKADFAGAAIKPNYGRFRVAPESTIALGTNVMGAADDLNAQAIELTASRAERADEMDAYDRLIVGAIQGDTSLFARQDYVEEAWRIVDPVIENPLPVTEYETASWGPPLTPNLIPPGGWHTPVDV